MLRYVHIDERLTGSQAGRDTYIQSAANAGNRHARGGKLNRISRKLFLHKYHFLVLLPGPFKSFA